MMKMISPCPGPQSPLSRTRSSGAAHAARAPSAPKHLRLLHCLRPLPHAGVAAACAASFWGVLHPHPSWSGAARTGRSRTCAQWASSTDSN
eukprot:346254-Pelagomonas_calceolata.AAC.1